MYFFSNSEVHLKYTLFQKNQEVYIIEVLLKYKQSTFLFFCFYTSFILFFEDVHLKHTSIGLQEESEV